MTFLTKTISLATAALLLSAPVAFAQDGGAMKKSNANAMMKKSDSSGAMMKKKPADGTGEGKGTATGGNAGGQAGHS